MEFLGESVSKAASKAVTDLAEEEAQGGVIALDDEGNGEPRMFRFSIAQSVFRTELLSYAARTPYSGVTFELSGYVSRDSAIRRITTRRYLL